MAAGRLDAIHFLMERLDCPEKFEGESWFFVYDEIESMDHNFWEIASLTCSERELINILRSMLDE